jgi:hypothetical protein
MPESKGCFHCHQNIAHGQGMVLMCGLIKHRNCVIHDHIKQCSLCTQRMNELIYVIAVGRSPVPVPRPFLEQAERMFEEMESRLF